MDAAGARWAWAEIDLGALTHNVALVRAAVAPSATWAVVKADAYGHGATTVAAAARAAGVEGLCVALVQEGVELRRAGIGGPILVLSEQPPDQYADLARHDLAATVYSAAGIAALAAAARASGRGPVGVHIKLDTGMRRVGADPAEVVALAEAVVATGGALRLDGVFTHLPVADEPQRPETAAALGALSAAVGRLAPAGLRPPLVHAANSAGALAHPAARLSFVRAGIALYGIVPGPGVAQLCDGLRPVMSLVSRVSFVKRVPTGAGISYGLRHVVTRPTTIATLPIGYADGVPRRLSSTGGEVLIGGRRRPIVGAVTMDQVMVDCGDDTVEVGDRAVLLGTDGDETIRAEEWAERLGTIAYEIVCGVSARIARIPRTPDGPDGPDMPGR